MKTSMEQSKGLALTTEPESLIKEKMFKEVNYA